MRAVETTEHPTLGEVMHGIVFGAGIIVIGSLVFRLFL